MFDKYKYKPCQCGCHIADNLEGNFTVTYICECECKPSKKFIKLEEENEALKKALGEPVPKVEWQIMQEENEKLKAENEELKKSNTDLLVAWGEENENYEEVIEENEQLKAVNKLIHDKYFQRNGNYVDAKKEIEALTIENERLKAENDYYKLLVGCKCPCHEGYMDCKCKCFPAFNKLQKLKAQLQNCDKASQVDSQSERKPHKCPVCKGIHGISRIYDDISDELKHLGIAKQDAYGKWFLPCLGCKGTGIVWEN